MTLHDGAAPTASDAHASWEGLPLYAHTPWDGTVLLFYKYVHIPNPEAFCAEQIALCERLGMTGRTRIAHEGINATYAGDKAAIEQYIMHMQRDQRFADVDFKTSPGNATHFNNLQVKVHKEIICMGEEYRHIRPEQTAPHLSPQLFHERLSAPGPKPVLLDCRNLYEYKIGHFSGAVEVPTRHFGDFPAAAQQLVETLDLKDRPVLAYCTGGIRCERATALLQALGCKDVAQLRGGIHRYLEAFPGGGLFEGRNLVFDKRESLAPAEYKMVGKCDLCGQPYDSFASKCRCVHCRVLVLVCPECEDPDGGYLCSEQCPALGGRPK